VADVVTRMGYQLPRGRKSERGSEPIRAGGIKAWRKKAMEAAAGSPIRGAYELRLTVARASRDAGLPFREVADRMLAVTAQDVRGAPALKTPVAGRKSRNGR
jgi:hypothetical protein